MTNVEAHDAVDLETPGEGWVTLDRKPAAALTKIAHGELGKQLALTSNAALNAGKGARGRALRTLVFDYYYSAGKNVMVVFDIYHT